MKEYVTTFGTTIKFADMDDFKIGDRVRYKKNFLGYDDRPPRYLEDYVLIVDRISRNTLVCTCAHFPGEFWYIHPSHLSLVPD